MSLGAFYICAYYPGDLSVLFLIVSVFLLSFFALFVMTLMTLGIVYKLRGNIEIY